MNRSSTLHPDEAVRVLILDDDLTVRTMMKKIIPERYELVITGTFEEFTENINSLAPNIIILDNILEDKNGIEICRSLKSKRAYQDVIVIIITASDDNETLIRGYEAGADDFVRKPFIVREIQLKLQVFENIIRSRSILEIGYRNQLSLYSRLYALSRKINDLLQQNTGPDSLLEEFAFITEIIDAGYLEVVIPGKKENRSLLALKKGNMRYRNYERLSKKLGQKVNTLTPQNPFRISAGDTIIHACMATVHVRRRPHARVIVEKETPFSNEEQELITLFLDFMEMLLARNITEGILEEKNINYREEISKARIIQATLLPHFEDVKGYDIDSIFLPASDVSGDFFDGMFLDEKTYQLSLVDVSGHGMGSAFIGNELRTLIRNFSTSKFSTAGILDVINHRMCRDLRQLYYFATAVILHLDLEEGSIRFCNAGHPDIMVCNMDKRIQRYPHTGPLIGFKPEAVFNEGTIQLQKGESLLVYTDGITEAFSPVLQEEGKSLADSMYGEERVAEALVEHSHFRSRDILHFLIEDLYNFTDYSEQDDDITAIALRRD
jgi:serine phosphatase RsbU (regulator of sigma subunit)/CheY-like chemotaxis protein